MNDRFRSASRIGPAGIAPAHFRDDAIIDGALPAVPTNHLCQGSDMRFLTDYPTLTALEAACLGITASTNRQRLASENTSYALGGVAPNHLSRLQSRYSQNELLFGLRILFRVGKGGNHRYSVVLNNGVILKYGAHANTEPSNAVQGRIVRCVKIARDMAYKAWLAFELSSTSDLNALIRVSYPDLITAVLDHHFRTAPSASAHMRQIIDIYKKIYRELSSHLIIADGAADVIGEGAVRWRLIYNDRQDAIASPFRTSAVRRQGDAQTITELKALPTDELAALARSRNVEPTAEALVMRRSGSIHIPFTVFEGQGSNLWSDLGLATFILHEASHKFGNTEDHAYTYERSKYRSLQRQLRLENADSYAYAAVSLYGNKLFQDRNDKKMKL